MTRISILNPTDGYPHDPPLGWGTSRSCARYLDRPLPPLPTVSGLDEVHACPPPVPWGLPASTGTWTDRP